MFVFRIQSRRRSPASRSITQAWRNHALDARHSPLVVYSIAAKAPTGSHASGAS